MPSDDEAINPEFALFVEEKEEGDTEDDNTAKCDSQRGEKEERRTTGIGRGLPTRSAWWYSGWLFLKRAKEQHGTQQIEYRWEEIRQG